MILQSTFKLPCNSISVYLKGEVVSEEEYLDIFEDVVTGRLVIDRGLITLDLSELPY